MSLTPPTLDDRTFEQLFQEARGRIPLYLPEWTDWNESDPGITLLQLHAWLTETVLVRLAQVPDLHFVKFLELIGGRRRPAQPATAVLSFTLNPRLKGASLLIPKGAQIGVADKNLERPVVFETERSLRAITATLARLVQKTPGGEIRDVTALNQEDGRGFHPFCGGYDAAGSCADGEARQASLLLGFASPLPFPRDEIGLQIELLDDSQQLLADAPEAVCDAPAPEALAAVRWEWWDGASWHALDVTEDGTRGLTRSGQIFFRVTGQIPAAPVAAVGQDPLAPLPGIADLVHGAEFEAALAEAGITTLAALAEQSAAELCELLLEPDDGDFPPEEKARIEALRADALRLLDPDRFYWLRVRLAPPDDGTADPPDVFTRPPRIDRILTNSVLATAAVTVRNEVLGVSNGNPGQVMQLANGSILVDPDFRLLVPAPGGIETWRRVDDFAASGPDSKHFLIDWASGRIIFGDGLRGAIPPASRSPIVAPSYRHGGGAIGNVGAGTVTQLRTPLPDVKEVTNVRPATGGADEEPLEDAKLRIPNEILKTRNRAVTLADFEDLAGRTPGAGIARAHARIAEIELPGSSSHIARAVRVVVLPSSRAAKPTPSEAVLRRVCAYLDERRLLTTRLVVAGPQYRDIDLLLDLEALPDADLRTVRDAVETRLAAHLHPLTGGRDGKGAPFGQPVSHAALVREIMTTPGVANIASFALRKFLTAYDSDTTADAALAADLAAEAERFATGPLDGETVPVTEAGADVAPVVTRVFTTARYVCRDLPLAGDELAALRFADIAVAYERSGSAP
jgi:hypothetical protein